LHIIGRFPFNSCETTALLLGRAIKNQYPLKEVLFVDGNCKIGKDRHFWIEVDALCYDLTADQFKNIKRPFFGVTINYHSQFFLGSSKVEIETQFENNDFYTSKVEQFDLYVQNITSYSNGRKTVG